MLQTDLTIIRYRVTGDECLMLLSLPFDGDSWRYPGPFPMIGSVSSRPASTQDRPITTQDYFLERRRHARRSTHNSTGGWSPLSHFCPEDMSPFCFFMISRFWRCVFLLYHRPWHLRDSVTDTGLPHGINVRRSAIDWSTLRTSWDQYVWNLLLVSVHQA